MKTRIIVIVSIFLNVGLLAAFFLVGRPDDKTNAAPPEVVTQTVTRKSSTARPAHPATLAGKDFNWSNIESDDYKQYIANMRAAGVPEETIRDIIIADVNKLYAARIAALRPLAADFKFWKTYDREARNAERERSQKERELQQEKRALIKELLGVDLDAEIARQNGERDRDAIRYGFLSPEKQEQLKALQEKYRDQERALFANGGGFTPENRAKFVALRAQQEAEMSALLTPAEFEEYQLRSSYTARNLRDNLTSFQPTEQEFREIFKLRKAFDDQYGMMRGGGGDDALRQARDQARQALEEQLKALLGDQRFKDYTLAQDDQYRNIYDFAQDNNLTADTVQKMYDVRVAAEAERQRIQSDLSLSPDQRQAQLTALANQTKQALGTFLGLDTFNTYQQSEGRWLNRLDSSSDGRGRGGPGRGYNGGGRFGGRRG